MKRSTDEARGADDNSEWRLAMRIASLREGRWVMKAAEWNPEQELRDGSRQQKIKKVGRKWKTSSQSRQQYLPAQGTSAEGKPLIMYDT